MKIDDKLVTKFIDDVREHLLDSESEESPLKKCESPIEQAMYLALKYLFEHFELFLNHYIFYMDCQKEIEVSYEDKKYRTDIWIHIGDTTNQKNHYFAIECDGHDFHEKTKQQVRKDRSRERDLMKEGYTVIRFAGSEIYENPYECALEVWKIIQRRINS